jgi:acyl-ACP thioesterase
MEKTELTLNEKIYEKNQELKSENLHFSVIKGNMCTHSNNSTYVSAVKPYGAITGEVTNKIKLTRGSLKYWHKILSNGHSVQIKSLTDRHRIKPATAQ